MRVDAREAASRLVFFSSHIGGTRLIIADFESCYNAGVKTGTSIKLAIAAVVVLLFAGFVLRAALRLAATAMHSLFGAFAIVVLILILFAKNQAPR